MRVQEGDVEDSKIRSWVGTKTAQVGGAVLVFAIVIAYYLTHKPFTVDMVAIWVVSLWRFMLTVSIVAAAGGIGTRLAPLLGQAPLSQIAFQSGLGLGIIGLAVLIIGSTISTAFYILWAPLVLVLVVLRKSIVTWLNKWRHLPIPWNESTWLEKIAGIYVLLAIIIALFMSLAPPVDFDALVYHLALPKTYLLDGKISNVPWIIYSGMPQLGEMLYTLVMQLGGVSSATLLSWWFTVLSAVGLFGFIEQKINRKAAWFGVASLLVGFSLVAFSGSGYVDWLSLLFGVGFFISLNEWIHDKTSRWTLLSGMFAGFTLGTKYTGGILALIGVLVFSVNWLRTKRGFTPGILLFSLTVIGTTLPWWIKNLVFVGNPFYPILGIFSANSGLRSFPPSPAFGNWQDIFLLPWRATFIGVHQGEGYSVDLGPLLLGFGILALLQWRNWEQKTEFILSSIMAIAGTIIWAVGNQYSGYLIQTRLYFPLFPAFVYLASVGFDSISKLNIGQVRIYKIMTGIITMVIAFCLIQVLSWTFNSEIVNYLLAGTTADQYVDSNLGLYGPAMRAVRGLSTGSKTLLLFEPRGLYCLPGCTPDDVLERWTRDYRIYQTPQAILTHWQEEGYTYLLYYRAGADFLRENHDYRQIETSWPVLDSLFASLPAPSVFGTTYDLYSLK